MLITKFEKTIILSLSIFSSIIIFLTIVELNKFNFYYLSFGVISTLLVLNSVTNKNYGNIFLNIFFYLGFFFKISIIILISNNNGTNIFFEETKVYLDVNSIFFKTIFIKLTIFFLFMIFFENFLIGKNKISNIYNKNSIENLIKKNKKMLFIFTLFFIIFFNYLNYEYKIIQRGSLNFSSSYANIFKIINYFAQSALICLIIDIEKKIDSKKIVFIYLLIFSSILNHLTILSRSGIFEILVVLYIFTKDNPKKGIYLIFLSISIWLVSFSFVNELRSLKSYGYNYENKMITIIPSAYAKNFEDKVFNISNENGSLLKANNEEILSLQSSMINKVRNNKFSYLFVYRWVGIDGFINTELKKDKNIGDLWESFFETKRNLKGTYYERNFFKVPEKNVFNQIFIPGFIAFTNFGNNYTFFLGSFFLIMIIFIFNKILDKFMRGFEYFKCFVLFIVSWRLAHFGVLPINTLFYFLSIIFFIITTSIAIKIVNKIYQ